eukprot:scaffold11.g4077.t1
MVKKKGAREMNPADAFRKTQRAKEIKRNKMERQLQREALSHKSEPERLRDELKEILELEQARWGGGAPGGQGRMNPALRLKKKALQHAYDQAIKKKMEEDAMKRMGGRGIEELAGEPVRRPEDSVYWHPTLNPMGIPPPGKPQKYKDDAAPPSSLQLPVPQQPPLPAELPPPPALPPPPWQSAPRGVITKPATTAWPPPLQQQPDGEALPPPDRPPPVVPKGATISGKTTVVTLPKAHEDKRVTALVPASVRVRREAAPAPKPVVRGAAAGTGPGFGLLPRNLQRPAASTQPARAQGESGAAAPSVDAQYHDFLATMKELGAV